MDRCFSVFSKHDHHAISVVPVVMENSTLVGSNVSFGFQCIETALRKYHFGLDALVSGAGSLLDVPLVPAKQDPIMPGKARYEINETRCDFPPVSVNL